MDTSITSCAQIANGKQFYTDGSFLQHTKAGGYAVVPLNEAGEILTSLTITGHRDDVPNIQTMELLAVIEAIRSVPRTQPVTVFTDHKTLVDVMAKPMRAKCERGVNRNLWNQLRSLMATRTVTLNWVRAHAGNVGNMAADRLARKAAYAQLAC